MLSGIKLSNGTVIVVCVGVCFGGEGCFIISGLGALHQLFVQKHKMA